jgi:hypothetical protein
MKDDNSPYQPDRVKKNEKFWPFASLKAGSPEANQAFAAGTKEYKL